MLMKFQQNATMPSSNIIYLHCCHLLLAGLQLKRLMETLTMCSGNVIYHGQALTRQFTINFSPFTISLLRRRIVYGRTRLKQLNVFQFYYWELHLPGSEWVSIIDCLQINHILFVETLWSEQSIWDMVWSSHLHEGLDFFRVLYAMSLTLWCLRSTMNSFSRVPCYCL